MGIASELVAVDGKYENLVRYLLGRTLVVDHIDHAIAIGKKYRHSLRMVTVEGESLNPGGSMTGGAFKNTSNLLSRRREIEEFEKTVRQLKQEMDELESQSEALRKERAGYYEKTDEIAEKLSKAYVIQNTAKMNSDQAKTGMDNARILSESTRKEADELDAQITDIADNQESITVELDTSESLEKELSAQIDEKQRLLEEEQSMESQRQKTVEEIHLAYAGLEQKYDFIRENLERIQEESEKFQQELEGLNANKGENSEEIQEKEQKIQELRETIENSSELFTEIRDEIEKYKKEREELTQRHKEFLQHREDLSKHMSALDKEIFRLESQKETSEAASEKQINYMWEEYEITYNHARELRDPDLTDLSRMKKRIQELKSEIRGLGNVNVNAIEEYKSVSERYEFLKGQHDDLVEAEATLEQIIEELDTAMRKQFQEQFARIAEEFNTVFKELFGGGKGTLELMEDGRYPGGRHPHYRTAAGEEAAEYDAAVRRGEGADRHCPFICDPESETIALLSSGRDRGGAG